MRRTRRQQESITILEKEENLETSIGKVKRLDGTIVLDSTDETDIIECSVEEVNDKKDFFKTPRSNLKRYVTESRNDVISLNDFKVKSETKSPGLRSRDSSRYNLRKSLDFQNLSVISGDSLKPTCTPKPVESDQPQLAVNKRLSSVKNTLALPYLSKSKVRNIEKWLASNDIETVCTPPFANLSVTPVANKSRPVTPTVKQQLNDSTGSSVDSLVKKVLVAVYGDDWKDKNVLKKSKTEPKKRMKILPNTKTEVKTKILTSQKKTPTVRRNILNPGRKLNLDESNDNLNVSGVKEINLDDSRCSDELVIAKNFTAVKKRGRRKNDDCDSLGSWKPDSVKKKRLKADNEVIKKQTPKNSNNESEPDENFTDVKKRGRRKNADCDSLSSWKPDLVKKKRLKADDKVIKKQTPKNSSKKVKASESAKKTGSPTKTPKKTFLASLSVSTPTTRCHPEAQYFKINFKSKKEELAQKLFKLYNSEVFSNLLPADMILSWNVKLRGTAGFCYNKRITKSTGEVIRTARIEFSTKVIDRADRLRDTLIHELCHAAAWVIDGVLDGHGSIWGSWAGKAMDRFPELPPIKRCHNYEIASKYTYRCTGCGYSINRHSKSIDTERKRCGYCFGVLELLVNKKRRGKAEVPEYDTTRTIRTPNNFALFVKENYHSVKSTKTNAKHAEIMKMLSQQYNLVKNAGTTPRNQPNSSSTAQR